MSARLKISPWITSPADLQAPLPGDRIADVVVVGAGYTGLSAALALKRAGVDVVLLERDFAGFGASGRNAGHLTLDDTDRRHVGHCPVLGRGWWWRR